VPFVPLRGVFADASGKLTGIGKDDAGGSIGFS